MLVAELSSIGDHRLDAVFQEEAPGQEELRIEILFYSFLAPYDLRA